MHRGGGLLGGGAGGHEVLGRLVEPGAELVDLLLQLDDPLDAREVDALLLRQPLHLAEQGDVAGGVAPPAACRPAGADEPQPVVAAEGLGVQPGELGGHRDHEDRAVHPGTWRQRGCHRRPLRRSARGSSPFVASA